MTRYIVPVLAAIVAILETTWLSELSIFGTRPDLILIMLTFHAHNRGVQRGQIAGFVVGLVEDSLSASPFGFFGLVRMSQGAILGFTKGSVSGDAIFSPMILVTVAVVVRTIVTFVITALFSIDGLFDQVFSITTLIEVLLTLVCAPPIFFILRLFLRRIEGRSRGLS
jgi:rod shape-determining protein MreD